MTDESLVETHPHRLVAGTRTCLTLVLALAPATSLVAVAPAQDSTGSEPLAQAPAPAVDDVSAQFLETLYSVRCHVAGDGKYEDRVYARAFALFGLEIDEASDDEIVAAIPPAVALRAARALDGWGRICVALGHEHYGRATRRVAAARALDPDPQRDELRLAYLERNLLGIGAIALEISARELPAETAIYVAESLDYAEDNKAGIALLERAIERFPDDFWLRIKAGHLLAAAKDPSRTTDAIAHLVVARGLDPASPWPFVEMSRAYQGAKDYSAAATIALEGLRFGPEFVPTLRVVSTNSRLAELYDQALANYRKLVRLEPQDGYFRNSLAWWLATLDDEEKRCPEEAVEHARKAAELDPEEDSYLNTLGVCYYRAGMLDQSVETLEQSIERTVIGKPDDFLFLAMAWQGLGEPDIARENFDKGLARFAGSTWTAARAAEVEKFIVEAREVLGIE